MRLTSNQKGVASLIITFLILVVMLALMLSMFAVAFYEQEMARHTVNSTQAYYAAESGLEDMLLRLDRQWNLPGSYSIQVGSAKASVLVGGITDNARTVESAGQSQDNVRKVKLHQVMRTDHVSFNYGVQAGQGGVLLENGSDIIGNVFSNGDVEIKNTCSVNGSVRVALNGNRIRGGTVSGDAYVDICENSSIGGTLHYNTRSGCAAAAFSNPLSGEIATSSLPLTKDKVQEWKQEALTGGVYSGDLVLGGWDAESLGPRLISGDLQMSGHAKLNMTGTLWVSGDVTISEQAEVSLDPAYGKGSGMLVADGQMFLKDKAKGLGSGQSGSYLGLVSTYASGTAISIMDTFDADILYTNQGEILIENTSNLKEVAGYRLHLINNSELTYDTALADNYFTGGPHGSWDVVSWQEVE